jgi:AraC-like DNA-binding protein
MNLNYKPVLKKVEPNYGSSFVLRNFTESTQNAVPKWHYHPEIEIVYIEEGLGKRHIGNNISYFENGDLLLIGSNLPHYGFPTRLTGQDQEIVLQVHESHFTQGFLDMVELSSIKHLLKKAKLGLSYYGETKSAIGESLKSMFYMNAFEKTIELVKILHIMSMSEECEVLNAEGFSLIASGSDLQRIDIIYNYVSQNFASNISLQEISQKVNLTVPALCRFFKRSTGKTFVQFLNEYRIAHACKLLSDNKDNISNIAFNCGFQNISNFNRAFKKVTGISPSEFRNERKLVFYADSHE